MGNRVDIQEKECKKILENPRTGEAGPLYWACRNGDVAAARKLVGSTDYSQLNQLESNGSTALHAAAHNGRTEIVRILLHEKSVMRHRRNRYGFTAYEEAKTQEIRALFDRPGNSQRFCSDVGENNGLVIGALSDKSFDDDDDDNLPGEIETSRLIAATSPKMICMIKIGGNLIKTMVCSPMMRGLLSYAVRVSEEFPNGEMSELLDENKAVAKIEQIINEEISPSHIQYAQARSLLSSYKTTGDITHLLRLYTLETPFYSNVNTKNQFCFINPVFTKLDRLQKRTFRGTSYRGLRMTKDDLRPYQWLHKNKEGVLIFHTFSSSSTEESVARNFIQVNSDDKVNVIIVFDFPKKCETAIKLFDLSAKIPAISEYPQEFEVLILPFTLFRLTNVTYDQSQNLYRIHLENFVSNAGIFTIIKCALGNK